MPSPPPPSRPHRPLLLALGGLALGAIAAGCNDGAFVPSPWSAQNVSATYATAEDLTVVRWSMSCKDCPADLEFDLLGATGQWTRIEFRQAPYPSGVYPCELGTCAQLVLRGRLPRPARAFVRTRHAEEGTFPGGAGRIGSIEVPVRPTAIFSDQNRRLTLRPNDQLIGRALPRRFAYGMWLTRTGACESELSSMRETGTLDSGELAGPPPVLLAEPGTYCVAMRGVPADGRVTPWFTTQALTLPETTTGEVSVRGDVVDSPIALHALLDLEAPDAATCATLRGTVRGALTEAVAMRAPAGSPGLVAEDVTTDCRPVPERRLDVNRLASQILDSYFRIVTTGRKPRVLLLYASNATSAPAAELQKQLEELSGRVQDVTSDPFALYRWDVLDPSAPALGGELRTDWPRFVAEVDPLVGALVPFVSPSASGIVALLDAREVQQSAGGYVKACRSPVRLAQGGVIVDTPAVQILPQAPPGAVLDTAGQHAVPRSELVQRETVVAYEVCRRFCDHPFVVAGSTFVERSWRATARCVRDGERDPDDDAPVGGGS